MSDERWDEGRLAEWWMGESDHADYVEGVDRSGIVVGMLDGGERVLELGCNVGRNLNVLLESGWNDLAGMEISPRAWDEMGVHFPELRRAIDFYEGNILSATFVFGDGEFDAVFTMAVLMHIHPDSIDGVCAEMARIALQKIIVVESEVLEGVRFWARDYREIFEGLGWMQDEELICSGYSKLGDKFIARRFVNERG